MRCLGRFLGWLNLGAGIKFSKSVDVKFGHLPRNGLGMDFHQPNAKEIDQAIQIRILIFREEYAGPTCQGCILPVLPVQRTRYSSEGCLVSIDLRRRYSVLPRNLLLAG